MRVWPHISALRTKSGKIHHATNLKYRYGQATMCSERIVIFQAENAGEGYTNWKSSLKTEQLNLSTIKIF